LRLLYLLGFNLVSRNELRKFLRGKSNLLILGKGDFQRSRRLKWFFREYWGGEPVIPKGGLLFIKHVGEWDLLLIGKNRFGYVVYKYYEPGLFYTMLKVLDEEFWRKKVEAEREKLYELWRGKIDDEMY